MYLITLLPYEINDNILIELKTVDLAVQFKRFWAASQLYSEADKVSEDILLGMIYHMNLEKKYTSLLYAIEKVII